MTLPDQVGQYRLLAPLGSGGMGDVWEAHDETLDRRVAIKVIRPDRATDPKTVKRFKREARLAASLDHPFICKVFDFQELGDELLIVMEYVEGKTLASVLQHGPVSVDYTIRIGRELAEALSLAHERGLVHRDIKPSNVMITVHGHVKAMDFGLAKFLQAVEGEASTSLTGVGTLVGTPSYMSPEQARGLPAGTGSDVFSFGVLLYRCLTGRLPFDGKTKADYLANLVSEDPRPLPDSVPRELAAVIERCLKKSPEERWSSFDEILLDLEELAAAREAESRSTQKPSPAAWPSPWAVVLVAGVVLVAVALLFLIGQEGTPPTAGHTQEPLVTWASHEWEPDISPDNSLLVFTSDRGNSDAVWVKDLRTGEVSEVVRAPSSGYVMRTPVWSPDGERIAYLREGEEDEGSFVEVIFRWGGRAGDPFHLEHSADIDVLQVSLLRWTEEGLYVDIDGSLWRLDVEGEGSVRLAEGLRYDDVDVRPGGNELVLSLFDRGQSDLWISDSRGGAPRRLTDTPFSEGSPRWRGSAGRKVLYLSDEGGQVDIWELDVDEGGSRRLTSSPLRETAFATSKDGTRMVHGVLHEESDLWALAPGEQGPSLVTDDSRGDFWPSVAGDSVLLAFHRRPPRLRAAPTPGALMAQIYTTRLGSPEEPRLVIDEGFGARLSPDGRWVAFLHFSTDDSRFPVLAAHNRLNRRRVRLAQQFHLSRWSVDPLEWVWSNLTWDPDQDATVYYVARVAPGVDQIRRTRLGAADAPESEPLATAEDADDLFVDIRLSGDSEALGFVASLDGPRRWEIRVLDLATREARPVYSAQDRLYLKGWVDETNLIVFREAVLSGSVEVLEVTTDGAVRRIGVLEGVTVSGAVLDRAGQRLVMNSAEHGRSRVMAFSLDDGRLSTLVEDRMPHVHFAGFTSAPDGTLVYARAQANRDLWTIELEQ